jgi:hypothetical protein
MTPKGRKPRIPEDASRAASVALPPFLAIQVDEEVRVYDLSGSLGKVTDSKDIPDGIDLLQVRRGLNR